jgi:hypothetical protein
MPEAVPVTSTQALVNATLPTVLALAGRGVDGAFAEDPGLARPDGRGRARRPSGRGGRGPGGRGGTRPDAGGGGGLSPGRRIGRWPVP